jgi:hypothetical protein
MTKTDIPKLLIAAKLYYSELPPVEVPKALLPVVLPPKELDTITAYVQCPVASVVWTSGRVPHIVQAEVPLRDGIRSADSAQMFVPAVSSREAFVETSAAEIRSRLAKQKGLKSPISVADPYRANLIVASRLSDVFDLKVPTRNVDPTQSKDTLRDIGRGLLTETLSEISKDPVKRAQLDERRFKDVALYTLLSDYKREKAEVNKLRASERMAFVKRMAQKSDQEREIIQDLLTIGLAPYIMTNQDRKEFAREAQRLQEEVYRDEAEVDAEAEEEDFPPPMTV